MSGHAWCSDTARDEAIRAAEDAAAAWRTPLPDHRDLPSAVHDLRRRVEGLETVADAWRRQCEADVEKREAAPGSRKGVSADGLRTERVTLEITHGSVVGAAGWSWGTIIRVKPGESVRVVDYATIGSGDVFADVGCRSTGDEIVRLTAERDAARRERDAAREEAEKATTLAKGLEEKRAYFRRQRDAAVQECERLSAEKAADWKAACESALAASITVGNLKARVAELERKCDELRSERERLIDTYRSGWNACREEIVAAIREAGGEVE